MGRAADACINQTRRAISSVRHLKSCATLHVSQVEQAKQEVGLLLALPTLLLRPETPGGGNAGRQDASGDDSGPGSTPPGAKVQAASQSFCAATRRRIKLAEKMEMQELLQDALGEAEAATEARASARWGGDDSRGAPAVMLSQDLAKRHENAIRLMEQHNSKRALAVLAQEEAIPRDKRTREAMKAKVCLPTPPELSQATRVEAARTVQEVPHQKVVMREVRQAIDKLREKGPRAP